MLENVKGSGLGAGANRILTELQSAIIPVSLVGAAANTLIPVPGLGSRDTILRIIKWSDGSDVTSGFAISDGKASGTLTVSGVVAGDTVAVNGVTYTAANWNETPSSGPVGTRKFVVGASNNATAANLCRAIQQYGGPTTASVAANVVTLTARSAGTAGNSISMTGSTHVTASGSTLSGGSATPGIKSATSTSGSNLLAWIAKKSR